MLYKGETLVVFDGVRAGGVIVLGGYRTDVE